LFERPSHTFVGHFIGSPGMNFLPAQMGPQGLQVCGMALALDAMQGDLPHGDLKLGIRPEYVRCAGSSFEGALPMQVQQVQDVGTHFIVTASLQGQVFKARLAMMAEPFAVGSTVWCQVLNDKSCFYRNEEIVA
jgi:glycerol transport system ATP-binding protein